MMTPNEPSPTPSLGRRVLQWGTLLAVVAGVVTLALYLLPSLGEATSAARAADAAPAPGSVPETQPDKVKKKTDKEKKEEKEKQALAEADAFFTTGQIPTLKIEMAKDDMDRLRGNTREDVGCNIRETLGGKETVYTDVAIHIKGAAGSMRGLDDKPGLTLSFDKYKDKQEFHRLAKINLNNGAQDGTFMIENLGNALYRDAGYAGARCTNARVWINQRDFGIYVLKEGFDDAYLKRFFPNPDGTLYEGGFVQDVNTGLTERANTNKRDRATIKEFIAAAQDGDQARRRARLEKVVDVDRFYTFMAMEALTAHWDGYTGNRNNYRIYHDPANGKVVFLPHGMDQLFQQTDYTLTPTNALVAAALMATPDDRAKYLDRVIELREKVLTPENINKHVDRISAFLAPAMKELNPGALKQHEENTKQVRNRALERVKAVDRQLAAIPKPLKFDAQGYVGLPAVKWEDKPDTGDVKIERVTEGGKSLLKLKTGNGGGGATIRQAINLPQGKYTFEAMAKPTGVTIAEGAPNAGIGLRVSGTTRTTALKGTADWTKITYDIDVPEADRAVVLVIEFRVTAGEALFDLASLKLKKR